MKAWPAGATMTVQSAARRPEFRTGERSQRSAMTRTSLRKHALFAHCVCQGLGAIESNRTGPHKSVLGGVATPPAWMRTAVHSNRATMSL